MRRCSKRVSFPAERLSRHRARVAAMRERTRQLFEGGATGIQVAADLSAATDRFLVDLLCEAYDGLSRRHQALVEKHSAVIAIGGSGRGELAPYSDSDLLFLHRASARQPFAECAARAVRDCWDSGVELGHSVRTLGDAISMGRQDPEFATALVESRLLWGDADLFARFRRHVARKVVRNRKRAFTDDVIAGRQQERMRHGATVNRLEPNVKRSPGGLRDVHLIRWIGFSHYGTGDIDSLRLHGALSKRDVRLLVAAQEFLMRVRIDLHLAAGRAQDILTREEQLRIARKRKTEATAGQRSVERFMQAYFQHSAAIANIADRFAASHQRPTVSSRLVRFVTSHRANGVFKVGQDSIDVVPRHRESVCGNLEEILKLYQSAVRYGVNLAPELVERLERSVPNLPRRLSAESARLFLNVLGCTGHLGASIRSMYGTGLLELIVPAMSHARCLLQFNEYHSYTVDEHSLRAVEAAEQFEQDDGPLGTAYRKIHHKELLHLALLLHDLGKGFEEDHSEVGKRIAAVMAERLQLALHQRDLLIFLVHKHLLMSHLAFRRDTADEELLLRLSHEVGSPETLRMLYVLSAADLTAVGPEVWTDWKAELLAELYDRTMLILSGKHTQFHEKERLQLIKEQVRASIGLRPMPPSESHHRNWTDDRLDAFPPHYLIATQPERIADDLESIGQLRPGEIITEGTYERETGTVDFRVFAPSDLGEGCFHKITGVLTAKRLEILTAQISTSSDGTVVDSFRVLDRDYAGEVPRVRIYEIADAIREVLTGRVSVEAMFQRHQRFGGSRIAEPISNLPMRVVIDNDSSDRDTIIDVFAHDRTGLLYTIARTIYHLQLSVMRARIATHFDQVVDVFYVTDANGQKIKDGNRLHEIRNQLAAQIETFERQDHLRFVT